MITLAAAGFDGSCLLIFAAAVELTFCVDFGGVAGGGVGTGADCNGIEHFTHIHTRMHLHTHTHKVITITLTSAVLLEAGNGVLAVVTLVLTVADLLVDINLSLLTGVVVVTLTTGVLLLVVEVMWGGVIFFPLTEAACA